LNSIKTPDKKVHETTQGAHSKQKAPLGKGTEKVVRTCPGCEKKFEVPVSHHSLS